MIVNISITMDDQATGAEVKQAILAACFVSAKIINYKGIPAVDAEVWLDIENTKSASLFRSE